MSRRAALRALTSGAVVAGTSLALPSVATAAEPALKGRVRQSVCRWWFAKTPLEPLANASRDMGIVALDLITPPDFATVKHAGLTVSLVSNPVADGPGGVKVGGITKPGIVSNTTTHSWRLMRTTSIKRGRSAQRFPSFPLSR